MKTKSLWLIVLLFWVWSCKSDPEAVDEPVAITFIRVSPKSLALAVGDIRQVEATPVPSNVDPMEQPFLWESADNAIATVSASGEVRAMSAGATEITVRARLHTAVFSAVPVTVTPAPAPITSIQVSPESLALTVGDIRQITATPSPSNVDPAEEPFLWESADNAIATVSASGEVRAMSAGATEITVRARLHTAVFSAVPVTVTPVPCAEIDPSATAYKRLRLTANNALQCTVTDQGDHDAITYQGGGNDPYAFSASVTQNINSHPAYIRFEYKSDRAVSGCEIFVFYKGREWWSTGVQYALANEWTCMTVQIPASIAQQFVAGSSLRFDLNPGQPQTLRIKNLEIWYNPSSLPPEPAIDMEKAIAWFYDRMERGACYNMNARYEIGDYIDLNNNGCVEGDCSSAVTYAVLEAGADDWGPLNTDSMHDWLTAHGFQAISQGAGLTFYPQRGDIFIWGRKGQSGGAAGHTGIFIDGSRIIHMTYGCNGICVSDYNQVLNANGGSSVYEYLYRKSEE
jgi:hypothetical protein